MRLAAKSEAPGEWRRDHQWVPGDMVVVKSRCRRFAPPVWRMLEVLSDDIDSWLVTGAGEEHPRVLGADGSVVLWSSLWQDRPDDRLRLDVEGDGSGSRLRWSLECPKGNLPDDERIRQMRYRINQLLIGQLRDHFDTRG